MSYICEFCNHAVLVNARCPCTLHRPHAFRPDFWNALSCEVCGQEQVHEVHAVQVVDDPREYAMPNESRECTSELFDLNSMIKQTTGERIMPSLCGICGKKIIFKDGAWHHESQPCNTNPLADQCDFCGEIYRENERWLHRTRVALVLCSTASRSSLCSRHAKNLYRIGCCDE